MVIKALLVSLATLLQHLAVVDMAETDNAAKNQDQAVVAVVVEVLDLALGFLGKDFQEAQIELVLKAVVVVALAVQAALVPVTVALDYSLVLVEHLLTMQEVVVVALKRHQTHP